MTDSFSDQKPFCRVIDIVYEVDVYSILSELGCFDTLLLYMFDNELKFIHDFITFSCGSSEKVLLSRKNIFRLLMFTEFKAANTPGDGDL